MTYGIESSEILRYSPPKSTAFGQISCPVNPQFAINKMSAFLSEWAERRMSAAHRFFSPGGCTEHSEIWYVDEKEVQSAVRFIFDDPPFRQLKQRCPFGYGIITSNVGCENPTESLGSCASWISTGAP